MADPPEIDIKIARLPSGPDTRKLDTLEWKVEITNGSPLLDLDGELKVQELQVGMEVLAPTIFGYFKGIVRKDDQGWDVEGESVVAIAEWCLDRECFVSQSSYSKAAAEELAQEIISREPTPRKAGS